MSNILSDKIIEEPKLLSVLDSLSELSDYYEKLDGIFGSDKNIYYMIEDGTLDRDDYYKAYYQYKLLDEIFGNDHHIY